MPLYEFECSRCGRFDVWLQISQTGQDIACPTCRQVARRVYTPPVLLRSSPELRTARAIEEKSAHEPEVVKTLSGRGLPTRHSASADVPGTPAFEGREG
jgi:putative FmdB family regulatory protein